ncbi:hypothetical protein GCM10022243_55030 [Saccharothrix violaceirubra]|uniref:DNA-binding MarR family transcriptional regulator n=1 Tax=Saccharothrix violaceirubra TaxID=413306 RepID=A0A7W7T640_9PSEU|nr:MarR family winged helix-turn-helix transcriptional regulator [Saccharothrix violaceirubra]MBB4967016.1 DNA-binding MarR family transcriptional regulator [Saccharothrix violaceirubra]
MDDLVDRLRDLLKAVRLVKQFRSERHPEFPVGMIATLTLIDRSGGCHAKELAATTGRDPSTVSRAVGTLVAHGLVERRIDPVDRRAGVLAVTDAGRGALAEARTWHDDLLRRVLADWSPAEVTALTAALGRLTTDIGKALDFHHTREAAR